MASPPSAASIPFPQPPRPRVGDLFPAAALKSAIHPRYAPKGPRVRMRPRSEPAASPAPAAGGKKSRGREKRRGSGCRQSGCGHFVEQRHAACGRRKFACSFHSRPANLQGIFSLRREIPAPSAKPPDTKGSRRGCGPSDASPGFVNGLRAREGAILPRPFAFFPCD